jgi:glycerophosphoryl diester phosphodiesterase
VTGPIAAFAARFGWPAGATHPLATAEAAGADIAHLCWERGGPRPQDLVTPELIAALAAAGRQIVLWHEERPELIADLVALPVLGICSDRPEPLRAALDGATA